MASQTNKFLNDNPINPINPKDRFALSNCKDICQRRVLEFFIPIIYLEKLIIGVTITTENTFFCALSNNKSVDWDWLSRMWSES